jgi:hypothetical protein
MTEDPLGALELLVTIDRELSSATEAGTGDLGAEGEDMEESPELRLVRAHIKRLRSRMRARLAVSWPTEAYEHALAIAMLKELMVQFPVDGFRLGKDEQGDPTFKVVMIARPERRLDDETIDQIEWSLTRSGNGDRVTSTVWFELFGLGDREYAELRGDRRERPYGQDARGGGGVCGLHGNRRAPTH